MKETHLKGMNVEKRKCMKCKKDRVAKIVDKLPSPNALILSY